MSDIREEIVRQQLFGPGSTLESDVHPVDRPWKLALTDLR